MLTLQFTHPDHETQTLRLAPRTVAQLAELLIMAPTGCLDDIMAAEAENIRLILQPLLDTAISATKCDRTSTPAAPPVLPPPWPQPDPQHTQ